MKSLTEEDIITAMTNNDYIVHLSPKKRYKIDLNIKNIRKGKIKIIETE